MKRHPALQKLSEDHHHGLVQAQRLADATPATIVSRTRAFLSAWRREIAPHFAEEEQLRQHTGIRRQVLELQRAHAAEDAGACIAAARAVAAALDEHIHFEERELFEAIQEAAAPQELARLGEYLAAWEGSAAGCRIE
ncbi:MAG: hemerythrin domain-containing protein [Armatimonadetes bacterium]|nr:hemerythrin domain-containing protein [Armatimonadota bacterium]